ncbi:hypothetical protein BS78_07G098800 [Paspalum vaginatum]|nr:hypothetical protein BS78_07G098800 [Paspalum vaginatum]
METFSSAMKNQLSFNKMLGTQIAQLAASLPNANAGKLPGQPEPPSKEHINAVTTRSGKSTQEPSHPSSTPNNAERKKDPGSPTISCSIGNQFFDQALCDHEASVSVMPKVVFVKLNNAALAPTAMCLQHVDQSVRHPAGIAEDVPMRIRNFLILVDFVVLDMEIDAKTSLILGQPFLSTMDASIDVGAREVHLYINGMTEMFIFKPKMEQCNQVKETFSSAMKNQLSFNKMLGTQIAQLAASLPNANAAILNQPPQNKKDLGSPTIPCSIGNQVFNQALCDLRARVSVMPKVVFDKLNHAALAPTTMCLLLVDQSI